MSVIFAVSYYCQKGQKKQLRARRYLQYRFSVKLFLTTPIAWQARRSGTKLSKHYNIIYLIINYLQSLKVSNVRKD